MKTFNSDVKSALVRSKYIIILFWFISCLLTWLNVSGLACFLLILSISTVCSIIELIILTLIDILEKGVNDDDETPKYPHS